MDFIIDAIVEWLKGLLVDGIMGNLDGLFDNVNQSVGEIATQVGTDRKSTRLNSSHQPQSRMPSSA